MISVPSIDILYYYHNIVNFFASHWPYFFNGLQSIIGLLIGISIVLSILLVIGIVFAVESLKVIRNKEEEKYTATVEPAYTEEKVNPEMAIRWGRIQEHINSPNENDWRQAIIEADIMLEDLLVKLGYKGEGVGERLKRVVKGDFKTLDQAWEAHMVRNRIAHDGSNYPLNQVEARKVIGLYRQVFEEFYHITG